MTSLKERFLQEFSSHALIIVSDERKKALTGIDIDDDGCKSAVIWLPGGLKESTGITIRGWVEGPT